MSTGYSWEGIRQVRATLLDARHVPERLCGGCVYLERYIKCSTFFNKCIRKDYLVLINQWHYHKLSATSFKRWPVLELELRRMVNFIVRPNTKWLAALFGRILMNDRHQTHTSVLSWHQTFLYSFQFVQQMAGHWGQLFKVHVMNSSYTINIYNTFHWEHRFSCIHFVYNETLPNWTVVQNDKLYSKCQQYTRQKIYWCVKKTSMSHEYVWVPLPTITVNCVCTERKRAASST